MSQVVVLVSGGFKSAVVASRARIDRDAHLLFADHSQPTAVARRSAVESLAVRIGASLTVVDIPPSDRIAEAAGLSIDPESSVYARQLTAGRHLALLSAGIQLAALIGANEVHVGASEFAGADSDHAPSHRRREYLYLANLMLKELQPTGHRIVIKAPLVDMSGCEIVKLGQRFKTPFECTWSCKTHAQDACGECDGCLSRRAAFEGAQLADPLFQTVEN